VEIHQTLSSLLIIYKPSDLVKIALIWDGAGYHNQMKLKSFWHQLMIIISLSSGQLLVLYLHPMPPEQNPVEDVWLQAKT